MDGYNHYIRIDSNNFVIHAFSDAFETLLGTDILVASDAGRHFNPVLTDSQGNYTYKWDGSQMVSRTNDADYLLAVSKQNKLAELKQKESDTLATFPSSALGTAHTYLSGESDMLLLSGQFAFVNTALYDGSLISWYTVENGQVDHTKDQFCQVYVDGRNHTATTKYHRADLEAQVNACTTVDAVNAIVW